MKMIAMDTTVQIDAQTVEAVADKLQRRRSEVPPRAAAFGCPSYCPWCGGRTDVTYTYHGQRKNITTRGRHCPCCEKTFKTTEVLAK